MCDFGISAIVASVVATAVSTTVGIVSSVQEANNTQAQYNYQAEVDKRNAQIAQDNAQTSRQEGIEEARQRRIKALQSVGAQQAQLAANNIQTSSGTALDLIEDTYAQGELEANTIRYKYEQQAQSYEQSAENYNNQSQIDVIKGQNNASSKLSKSITIGMNGLSSAMTKLDGNK